MASQQLMCRTIIKSNPLSNQTMTNLHILQSSKSLIVQPTPAGHQRSELPQGCWAVALVQSLKCELRGDKTASAQLDYITVIIHQAEKEGKPYIYYQIISYIFYLLFIAKMMIEGQLENSAAKEIVIPLMICKVISAFCPLLSEFKKRSEYVCWVVYDFFRGSLLVAMHSCERVGNLLALHIAWALWGGQTAYTSFTILCTYHTTMKRF